MRLLDAADIRDIPPAPPVSPPPWFAITNQPNHLNETFKKIADHVTSLGQERWDAEETGRFYYELQPTVGYRLEHHHKPRKKDVILTRLRMNHTRLAAGLYKINIGESANCAIRRVPETVKHWILDCPNQRYLQHCLSAECTRSN